MAIKAIESFSRSVCGSIRFAHSSVHQFLEIKMGCFCHILSSTLERIYLRAREKYRRLISDRCGFNNAKLSGELKCTWVIFKWSYISQACGFLLLSRSSIKVRSHDPVWTRGKRLTELEPAVGTITTNFVLSWSSALPLCNEPSWKTIEQGLVCCHWKSGCVVRLSRNFALK